MILPFKIPFPLVKPVLHALDPEVAHTVTIKSLKAGLAPQSDKVQDESLHTEFCNLKFDNPVGLAAGFDKNAEVIAPMFGFGFGFIEVGGVTTVPQKGLPKPRIFRDPINQAIINKMNFPNVGVEEFKNNVERFKEKNSGDHYPLGIQIAKSADQKDPDKDFKKLLGEVGDLASYVTVNISCPNTEGLRDLEQKNHFTALLSGLMEERDKLGLNNLPIITKFSPDLSPAKLDDLAEACLDIKIDGVILANTTTSRPSHLPEEFSQRQGGLSGKPLTDMSTEIIRSFYKKTNGQVPIIGVGGISSGLDAYNKIKAGATLVQLYSALVFKGPEVINEIKTDLIHLLKEDGYSNIREAVGTNAQHESQ
ncbi:MAG: quinone-dependent dihydroorotate dehydrogenase [Pseudomonadota bacterium]